MPPPPPGQAAEHQASRGWALTFEHSPIGMAVVALDGSWRQVNQALCLMLGYDAERLMSMTFQDITHPDDLERDLDLLQECLAGDRDGYRMVKRYRHADGHRVWGDLSVALVRDQSGPLHFLSQILDVSDHRADKARLEVVMNDLTVANQDLAQFATVISHDLKTPLATIRASLELLTDALPEDAPVDSAAVASRPGTGPRALAGRAEAATERMAALIDALLAYTITDPRLRGTEGWHTGTSPTRLLDVVRAALADVAILLDGSGAEVHLEPRLPDAPEVQVSPALIRTLLVNLLSNAVKYRDAGRALCIRIGAELDPADAGRLVVTVSNDGPSIAAADRDQLFALFARGAPLDAGGTSRAGADVPGHGIGLAACRRIVSWHGGQIWFADPEGECGVVVRFSLPRSTPPV